MQVRLIAPSDGIVSTEQPRRIALNTTPTAQVAEDPTNRIGENITSGAPGRIRTADAGLRTAALYPLSYGGTEDIVPRPTVRPGNPLRGSERCLA